MKSVVGIPQAAAWVALLVGLGEAALFGVASLVLHRYTHQNPQFIWMSAISMAALFVIPAMILIFLMRNRTEEARIQAAITVFGFLGAFALLLAFPKLHIMASVALALGIAVQAGRSARAHAAVFSRLVRVTVWPMVGVVCVLAISLNATRAIAERREHASLPAAQPDAPNVILLILDTVRASRLSLYGNTRATTPRIDSIAGHGVHFTQALSPAPWTLPSHASMFTGRLPHEMSASWRTPFGADHPTLAEVLRARGYATGGFVANYFYVSRESGLHRGFTHYEDFATTPAAILSASGLARRLVAWTWLRERTGYLRNPGAKDAPRANRDLLRWLSKRGDRPFFAFVNYFDAHAAYDPPAPFDTRFRSTELPRNPFLLNEKPISTQNAQPELDAYDGALAFLDAQIGDLIDSLDARGKLRNTLLILTSDHGEEFGEHGLLDHGKSLYMPVLHVPLVIVFPGRVPAGNAIRVPVSTRDVPATVLQLLGEKSRQSLPGRSLARYWTAGEEAFPEERITSQVRHNPGREPWLPTSAGDMASLLNARHHFIRNGDGRAELYDVIADPLEQRNLAGDAAWREYVARYGASLDSLVPTRSGR